LKHCSAFELDHKFVPFSDLAAGEANERSYQRSLQNMEAGFGVK
jgi:hypothetical protein